MKCSSQSIFHSPGKYSGCSSVAEVHPSCTCCGPIPSSALCLPWCDSHGSEGQAGVGSEKWSGQKLHQLTWYHRHQCTGKSTSVKPAAKEKHSFGIYRFRTLFPGNYWGDCPLPLLQGSSLVGIMTSAYADMQLIKKTKKTKQQQNKAQENHSQNTKTLERKNNTQEQNWQQLPQLGQGTDLVYCVAAQKADLAVCKNGNSSWVLLLNVNFECLQTSLIF